MPLIHGGYIPRILYQMLGGNEERLLTRVKSLLHMLCAVSPIKERVGFVLHPLLEVL